jgi:hypothetical protein
MALAIGPGVGVQRRRDHTHTVAIKSVKYRFVAHRYRGELMILSASLKTDLKGLGKEVAG